MPLNLQQEKAITPFIADTREDLGVRAAADIAAELRQLLAAQTSVRMIFAAAPSQSEMLAALIDAPGIDWTRVTAFHMDEYLDLSPAAPQRFGIWLRRHLFDHLPFKEVHLLEPGENPELFAKAYAAKLAEQPIDIVCCGIGSNGHLAFNDPPANFHDPQDVKVVHLDDACRQQQVDDDCFATVEDVPARAVTLTIPRLLAAARIFCCVPGSLKAEAVCATLEGPITPDCPASILRRHAFCSLYLDKDAAALLTQSHGALQ